jgi:hypothetical protein
MNGEQPARRRRGRVGEFAEAGGDVGGGGDGHGEGEVAVLGIRRDEREQYAHGDEDRGEADGNQRHPPCGRAGERLEEEGVGGSGQAGPERDDRAPGDGEEIDPVSMTPVARASMSWAVISGPR